MKTLENGAKDNRDLRGLRRFADSVDRVLDRWGNDEISDHVALCDIDALHEKFKRGGFDD